MLRAITWAILPGLIALTGCSKKTRTEKGIPVGVTTSWLECAIHDVAGRRCQPIRLSSPGDCPGHFDLAPGTLRRLSGCSLLFRFDFQAGLDSKLSGLRARGLRVVPVAMPGGLCVPQRYLSACRQVEEILQRSYPWFGHEFRERVEAVEKRLSDLSEGVQARIAGASLRGEKIVCSEHQSDFCDWLGLEIVAEFSRAEDMTSSEVEKVIAKAEREGARLIIANLQEGRRAAEVIGRRVGARVIGFSNFPSMAADQRRFEDLVLDNVESLIQGVGR